MAHVQETILSLLEGVSVPVKSLRKQVFVSLQLDSSKANKKLYKKAVQDLEATGAVRIDAEGNIRKRKQKKRKIEHTVEESQKFGTSNDEVSTPKASTKVAGNPQNITRLFLGNLAFSVDESSLRDFIPGLKFVKWITDKETGKFYGSAFCEMESSEAAAQAVGKAGTEFLGRPLKVNYAPARPGDVWPPTSSTSVSGGAGATSRAGGRGLVALAPMPPNCVKLFVGNVSFQATDEDLYEFFGDSANSIKQIRWLHHKDSGDFKGCGYIEFTDSERCSKAAKRNGDNLLGRPIRIDWAE